jgi:hypothetical protein
MVTGVWTYFATPAASLIIGVAALALLVRCGYHRDENGGLSRRKMASVLLLAASTYTFMVLITFEFVLGGPDMTELIARGFGSERIGWLMVGVSLDGMFRVWEEFQPATGFPYPVE